MLMQTLIPLSYATITGGVLTMIGTSTNLLVQVLCFFVRSWLQCLTYLFRPGFVGKTWFRRVWILGAALRWKYSCGLHFCIHINCWYAQFDAFRLAHI